MFVTNDPNVGVSFLLPGAAVTPDACRCALAELVRSTWLSRLYKKKDCEATKSTKLQTVARNSDETQH